jgi:hypothetical protein
MSSESWDSHEQLQAFGERLMPLPSEVGLEAGAPELLTGSGWKEAIVP